MKCGDLVSLNQVFFGYDNIPEKWESSVFIVVSVREDKSRIIPNSYIICEVISPDGTLCDFFDYELRNLLIEDG